MLILLEKHFFANVTNLNWGIVNMSLEVKGLVKQYGSKTVVNNLNFIMEEPGVCALLGTNGAGKTTSIRMLLGMIAKDGGEVLWNGVPLDLNKIKVGYLAEERGLYPKYTLMDQLLYFARLKRVPKNEAKQRIAYWSKRLELNEYLYPELKNVKGKKGAKPMKADQLSKGNQQKIQLMAALISDPDLLIFDEPLSGLDPVNTDLFKGIIREELDKGKYLIMSSHQMSTVEEFCEDIIILDRGETVLAGNLNDIKKSYGRINLEVKCDDDFTKVIEEHQLHIVEVSPNMTRLKVKDELQARKFLKGLMDAGHQVDRFDLREPTLHEIFVEIGRAHV